jgi:hypothetical protein
MEIFGLYLRSSNGEFDILHFSGDIEDIWEVIWSEHLLEEEYLIKDLF